jgi:hypothetical protein
MSKYQFILNTTCPYEDTLLGDGFCNDETNTEECQYDAGDCCKNKTIVNVCENCTCNQNIGAPAQDLMRTACPIGTEFKNGYCNDEVKTLLLTIVLLFKVLHFMTKTNTPNCGYDFGECCGKTDFTFCDDCNCLDPRGQNLTRGGWYHVLFK